MSTIYVPKKINVGYQNRNDTYTGKLAYVIYYDEKGKLRKETSWNSWRDEKIPNNEFENVPTEGFVLNKHAGGVENSWGWNARKSYCRVYDPRGFEFEITIENLLYILENCSSIKGKGLEGEFDLIILDLMLPGVDGFEICRQIRSQKNTPIIMVSAKKDDIDKIRGLGLGADDYMTKPFSPSELVARVKAHLARYERLIGSNVEQNEVIEIRGLKIDKTARRVWVNGEEKSFTTKEFDLLTFLAGHPNHVYSKEELFREIWDMESIGDIATVTVHIKKIREKIEYDTSHPQYIETIWGVGYRFKV